MPVQTPARPRPRRDYRTAKRLTMDATAVALDAMDRLEELGNLLRDITATLHRGEVRAAQPWDGVTERRKSERRKS